MHGKRLSAFLFDFWKTLYRTTIVRRFLNDAALMYAVNRMDMYGALLRQLWLN